MKTNWKGVSYDDIEVPQPLYKFRTWNDEWHKALLSKQTIFLAPPSGFEDPLDCKIPIRYELRSHREQNNRFFDVSVQRHPHWSKKRHKKFAKYWMKRTPIRNPQKLAQKRREDFHYLNKRLGVFCLTPMAENFSMWEKYGDNHKGFCVGFNGKELLADSAKFGMTGHVEYYDKLPIIHPNEEALDKANKQTFSKLRKWEFENEYRTTKLKPENEVDDEWRNVKVEKEKFVEIIFGAHMPKEHKKEIIEVAKEHFSQIKFRQAEIDTKQKTVNIIDLNI